MKVFFYQNILSLHQSSFIRELSFSHEVYLYVEEELYADRKQQGWSVPDFGKAKIVISPTENQLLEAVKTPDSLHILSGFRAYKIPVKVLKLSKKYNFKLGIMTEPFKYFGIKGFFRKLVYLGIRLKWNKKIDFILTIGSLASRCYREVGFSEDKLFDWAYVTEDKFYDSFNSTKDVSNINNPKLLFVGSIDKNKNLLKTLEFVVNDILDDISEFIIIGKGPLIPKLEFYTSKYKKIKFLGTKDNSEVLTYMQNADILILPSLYDGWGAVINESLTVGTPVICSNHCGAQILINSQNGRIFSISENNFVDKFYDLKKNMQNFNRDSIRKFMLENVSGSSASAYLNDIIKHIYFSEKRPVAPWIKNKI